MAATLSALQATFNSNVMTQYPMAFQAAATEEAVVEEERRPKRHRRRSKEERRRRAKRKNSKILWFKLPIDVKVQVLQFLEGPDDLASFAVVSRQCWADSKHPSLSQERIMTIRCTGTIFGDDTRRLMLAFQAVAFREKPHRERFTTLKLIGHGGVAAAFNQEVTPIQRGMLLRHVKCLDMSLPPEGTKKSRKVPLFVPRMLTKSMPNLLEVNFSYCNMTNSGLELVAKNCPLLEKLTCHAGLSSVLSCGQNLRACKNLREIHMDDTDWYTPDDYAILFQQPGPLCLFFHCMEHLERVSIKNASYRAFTDTELQMALFKFVVLAPELRWFRSGLHANFLSFLKEQKPHLSLEN